MATKQTAAQSIAKTNPTLLVSGAVTVVATLLYVAPAFGIKLPEAVTRGANVAFTIASALGAKSLLKPA
jgi:hypothetical protein